MCGAGSVASRRPAWGLHDPQELPGGEPDKAGHAGYVHLFGAEAELKLVQRISRLEAEHRRLLCELPAAVQASFHARHRQASTVPGALPLICSQGDCFRVVHEDARLMPSTAFEKTSITCVAVQGLETGSFLVRSLMNAPSEPHAQARAAVPRLILASGAGAMLVVFVAVQ